MAIELRQPDHVTTRFTAASARADGRLPSPAEVAGVVVRGLLIGIGIALVVVAGPAGVESVVAAGILALGAALLGWDH